MCACSLCIKVHAQLPDVVYNTLLELYLSDMGSCSQEDERTSKELKAMGLLKKPEVCNVYCVRVLPCDLAAYLYAITCSAKVIEVVTMAQSVKKHSFHTI